MGTESITKPTGPLRCTCGDEVGPFTADGRCEDCADTTSEDTE